MANEFKIEKGVAFPSGHRGRRYPLREMEVGDSFLVPFEGDDVRVLNTVRKAVNAAQMRTGRKFSTRTVEGGLRVWRIA